MSRFPKLHDEVGDEPTEDREINLIPLVVIVGLVVVALFISACQPVSTGPSAVFEGAVPITGELKYHLK